MPFKYQHVIISQKTGINIHTASRTSNLPLQSSSFYFLQFYIFDLHITWSVLFSHKELLQHTVSVTEIESITYIYIYIYIYRMSREECARLREDVPEVKIHQYNQKHLYLKVNGYGDNGERKVWSSCGSTYCS